MAARQTIRARGTEEFLSLEEHNLKSMEKGLYQNLNIIAASGAVNLVSWATKHQSLTDKFAKPDTESLLELEGFMKQINNFRKTLKEEADITPAGNAWPDYYTCKKGKGVHTILFSL